MRQQCMIETAQSCARFAPAKRSKKYLPWLKATENVRFCAVGVRLLEFWGADDILDRGLYSEFLSMTSSSSNLLLIVDAPISRGPAKRH